MKIKKEKVKLIKQKRPGKFQRHTSQGGKIGAKNSYLRTRGVKQLKQFEIQKFMNKLEDKEDHIN